MSNVKLFFPNSYENNIKKVHEIIDNGIKKAKVVATETMHDVAKAMKMG